MFWCEESESALLVPVSAAVSWPSLISMAEDEWPDSTHPAPQRPKSTRRNWNLFTSVPISIAPLRARPSAGQWAEHAQAHAHTHLCCLVQLANKMICRPAGWLAVRLSVSLFTLGARTRNECPVATLIYSPASQSSARLANSRARKHQAHLSGARFRWANFRGGAPIDKGGQRSAGWSAGLVRLLPG